MNKKATILISFFSFMLLATSLLAATVQSKSKTKSQPVPKTEASSYKIGAGDVLRIVTWKEVDFTLDDILVRTDGKISFPLLNDVQAAGLTPLMLKDVIESSLKAYVSDPLVTVTVINPGSKRFYILGEVLRTGEYPLIKELTVLQAFSMAGGFTEWASKKEIILIRREGGKRKVIKINYKAILKAVEKGKDLEQNVLIKANDTIIVP